MVLPKHIAQYFHHDGDGITFLEKAIRYGSKFQKTKTRLK